MIVMDEKDRMLCHIEELKKQNDELKYQLQKYDTSKFAIITRDEAIAKFLKNPKLDILKVNCEDAWVSSINTLKLEELIESDEIFYIIRKGW